MLRVAKQIFYCWTIKKLFQIKIYCSSNKFDSIIYVNRFIGFKIRNLEDGLLCDRSDSGSRAWHNCQTYHKSCGLQTTAKKSSKFTKKNHTCRWYDDTQFCKISYPNSILFVRYKNNKFQTKSSLDKIFPRLCIIISSTCVIFFGKFRRLFFRGLHRLSRML